MGRIDDRIADSLAWMSIQSSRKAKTVVLLALLVTAVFAVGVSKVTTDVDVADVLPRGDPNTDAAHNLTERFRSTFTQQVTLQLHVDIDGKQWAHDNALLTNRVTALGMRNASSPLPLPVPIPITIPTLPGLPAPDLGQVAPFEVQPNSQNITDEVYVRAMEEMVHFIQDRTDLDRSISINNIYALVNWTVAGGQGQAPDSAFALPPSTSPADETRYLIVDYAVKEALLDTVDAISSPSWNHAVVLFMPAADSTVPTKDLGDQMIAARNAYVQAVCEGKTTFTVFGDCDEGTLKGYHNTPLFTVDLPIANAHSSALVREDTIRLMPLVAAYILIVLYLALRHVRAILVSFSTLAMGVVWSYGTMGFMHIPLNTLNMTIVPLVMGIGIDYSIHIINEYLEHKSEGHSDAEAFRLAGSRSGVAMLIATATTVGGLATLIFSPSLLIAQLGIVSTVALTVIYLLAITFVPAALTLLSTRTGMGHRFTRSRAMPAFARGVTKVRYLVLIALVVVSVLAYAGTQRLEKEAFGDPGKNYLKSDPIRQEHEKGLSYFYEQPDSDEKANILAFEGPGILTPDAIRYYRAIEANLKTKDRIIPDTLRTLPFFIETWLTIKGGAPTALESIARDELTGAGIVPRAAQQSTDPFPTTEAGIRDEVTQMFQSPMKELAAFIVNYPVVIEHPDQGMAAMTFSVRAATYDEASEVWDQIHEAIHEADLQFGGHPPAGVTVAFVGNTATNYLFIAKELPWLTYMNIVDNIMLVVLVFAMTRSVRITFVTLVLSTLTSLWWLAILPFMGIGLAITLVLPMAFIIAIGTDYGIHFMWNIKQTKNAREVFESTGKAVLFSAITTTGAFTFFIFLHNVAVRRTMIATTVAFGVIFLVTLLTVPVFFPVAAKDAPKPPKRVAPNRAPTPTASPGQTGKAKAPQRKAGSRS